MLTNLEVQRHRTAIGRTGLSRPVTLAIRDELLQPGESLFDYGCGRGQDITRLRSLGYHASGWDPVHAPLQPLVSADVVNLGYVVNVIENLDERANVVRKAWTLAKRVLIVAARLTWERTDASGESHADGILTRRKTFQKFFGQEELRAWLEEVLGEPAVAAAPGIFYVFRARADAEGLRERRLRRHPDPAPLRTNVRLAEAHKLELEDLARFVKTHGRPPEPWELRSYDALVGGYGSIKRAMSALSEGLSAAEIQSAAERTRGVVLVHLALAAFRGRPLLKELPPSLQRDITTFFGSYQAARREADDLLFAVADRTKVEESIATMNFGKRLPDALYFHVSGLTNAPPLIRVYEGCATILVGRVDSADVIKLNRIDRKVTYLSYPAFDTEAHPALAASIRCDLKSFDVRVRDFQSYANPPVLHRKDSIVPLDYPARGKFARLTKQEERAGLLGAADIGNRHAWENRLQAAGFVVRGHRLLKMKPPEPDSAP